MKDEEIYKSFPDVQTIAEESTAFPGVSRPTFLGGLGFGMKWMMGWMHDTFRYFKTNPDNPTIIKFIVLSMQPIRY